MLVACMVVLHPPASAQRWQVDLGGSSVGYDTLARASSASVSPLIAWEGPAAYATLSGALAAFAAGQSTAQGRGDLSLLFAPAGEASRIRMELVGSADGSVHSSGYRTVATRSELRFHMAGPAAGVWLGGSAATAWALNSAGITWALGPTVGAWGRIQTWNFTTIWSPYRLAGYWFSEAQGRVAAALGSVDLAGYLGWRIAPSASGIPNSAWGGGTCAVWFAPRAALVLGAGTYPSDLLEALPKGSYLSLAIRLSKSRPTTAVLASRSPALYAKTRGPSEFRFAVPGAARVDLVGDWTGWQPVPLERASNGQWVIRTRVGPGVHRFNLVVDGERWIVPEGSAAVDDGFGGKTALLVVP